MRTTKALEMVMEYLEDYYGYIPNIVQTMKDPKVDGCYVFRCEGGEEDNWCFVVNFHDGNSLHEWMIDDAVTLEPGEKLKKSMFTVPRFI